MSTPVETIANALFTYEYGTHKDPLYERFPEYLARHREYCLKRARHIAKALEANTSHEARRLERIHQALYLWNLVEESEDEPSNDYQRGADMAYRAAAGFLLADVSRGPFAGQPDEFDLVKDYGLDMYPSLVQVAQQYAQLTTVESTGEVDRAIQALGGEAA
jgi:hypothetical protein